MAVKIDPFTLTPGVAGKPYIDMGIAEEIIANFKSEESYKYVYKITGLRGSGKSVEYSKILQTFEKKKSIGLFIRSQQREAVLQHLFRI